MFDSHCHLHDPTLIASAPALLVRARAAGVSGMLLAGVDPEGWQEEDRLARAHPELFVSYGVHPEVVASAGSVAAHAMVEALERALADPSFIRAVAIGEIGLDCVGERRASLPLQIDVFRAQLRLAHARELPVALHILHAHGEALAVLRDVGVPSRGGVVHSYSGEAALAAEYLALGLCISLAGPVTYGRKAKETARVVPEDRLLVETDAPDQTPLARRPDRNEPSFLSDIVAAVADARGESASKVAAYTERNARRLFGLEGKR